MSIRPHVLSVALLVLASACGSSDPPCGSVNLTFSNVLGVVPDIGMGSTSQTAPVDTTSANVIFTTTGTDDLLLGLPGPLAIGQYDSVQISYYLGQVGGGATTHEWSGGGTVRVESVSPTVKLTFINDVMIPTTGATGTFTINGTGEWTTGSGCSAR